MFVFVLCVLCCYGFVPFFVRGHLVVICCCWCDVSICLFLSMCTFVGLLLLLSVCFVCVVIVLPVLSCVFYVVVLCVIAFSV